MSGLKAIKKTLQGPLDKSRRRRVLPTRPRPKKAEEPVTAPTEEVPEPEETVEEAMQDILNGPRVDGPGADQAPQQPWSAVLDGLAPLRPDDYDPLDDVPVSVRKRLRELGEPVEPEENPPDTKKLKTNDFANYVLTALSSRELKGTEARSNEWLPRAEVERFVCLAGPAVELSSPPPCPSQTPSTSRSSSQEASGYDDVFRGPFTGNGGRGERRAGRSQTCSQVSSPVEGSEPAHACQGIVEAEAQRSKTYAFEKGGLVFSGEG